MRAQSAKIKESLNKIISSPAYAKALREPIITMRGDRYVVPVKAESKAAIPGLVHDVSSSGGTFFIEPMSAVNANNALRELALAEQAEIERILAELSAMAAEHRDQIETDYELLTELLRIAGVLRCARNVKAYGDGDHVDTVLDPLLSGPAIRSSTPKPWCPSPCAWAATSTPWSSPAPIPAARP